MLPKFDTTKWLLKRFLICLETRLYFMMNAVTRLILCFSGDDPRYDVTTGKLSMSTKAQNDENEKTLLNGEASSSTENIVGKNNNVEKSPVAAPPTSRFAVEPTVETSPLSSESDKTSKTNEEQVVAVAVEATENQN